MTQARPKFACFEVMGQRLRRPSLAAYFSANCKEPSADYEDSTGFPGQALENLRYPLIKQIVEGLI